MDRLERSKQRMSSETFNYWMIFDFRVSFWNLKFFPSLLSFRHLIWCEARIFNEICDKVHESHLKMKWMSTKSFLWVVTDKNEIGKSSWENLLKKKKWKKVTKKIIKFKSHSCFIQFILSLKSLFLTLLFACLCLQQKQKSTKNTKTERRRDSRVILIKIKYLRHVLLLTRLWGWEKKRQNRRFFCCVKLKWAENFLNFHFILDFRNFHFIFSLRTIFAVVNYFVIVVCLGCWENFTQFSPVSFLLRNLYKWRRENEQKKNIIFNFSIDSFHSENFNYLKTVKKV